jgi:hypothetical protein
MTCRGHSTSDESIAAIKLTDRVELMEKVGLGRLQLMSLRAIFKLNRLCNETQPMILSNDVVSII